MQIDLREVFSLDSKNTDALDNFIAGRLADAGFWSSPRCTDGIPDVRLVEHEPTRVSACGRLYEIDQSLHSFWLVLEHEPDQERVVWSLYFDVIADTARHARHAIYVHDSPDEVDWRIALTGSADVVEHQLICR